MTGPTSGTYTVGQSVPITWTAANVVAGSKISLCYDTDTTFNGNEHWIEIDGVAASNGGGTYTWNTTGVAAGTYYLAGYMYDGEHLHVLAPHPGHHHQQAARQPQAFAVTGPTSGTYQAGQTVNIPWTAANVAAGGKISLCYDTDTTFNGNEHWIEIDGVAASNSGGTYAWNTTGVAAGTYYVAGYMYGGGTFTMSHLTQAITIQGQAAPRRSRSRARLPARIRRARRSISRGRPPTSPRTARSASATTPTPPSTATNTGSRSTAWRPPTAAARMPGTPPAWRRARTTSPATCMAAARSPSRTSPRPSPSTARRRPDVRRHGARPPARLSRPGQTVNIPWTASNVAANGKISLCYDTDTTFNGNEHWIEIDGVPASNSGGTYAWNTTGVAAGTYYLAGYMYGGGTFTFSHLTQAITITAAAPQTFAVSLPTPTAYHGRPDGQYPVDRRQRRGQAARSASATTPTPPSTATNTGSRSTACRPPTAAAAYAWNTTGVATGTYYLAGYMYDGGSTFTISHLNQAITIGAALTLATPQEQVPASLPADAVLESQSELTPIVNEAIHRLLGASGGTALADVSIQIADLPGMLLGETIGNKILIDRDAAGYGWFIDPTPADDVGVRRRPWPVRLGRPQRQSRGYNRADLLTTVMHEMGHVLGYEHSNSLDLMYPTLPLGDRRFLAGGAVSAMALAAENNSNQSAANTNVLDDVLASFNADNKKKDWSWL